MPLEQPGFVDLLKKLTGSSSPTTSTDATAISQGFDPGSPEIVKSIAAAITKIKETGSIPDPETAASLGEAFKSHLEYTKNLNLLQQLNKAYTAKYGVGPFPK